MKDKKEKPHALAGRTSNRWQGKEAERTKCFTVKSSPEDAEKWAEAAKAEGVSRNEWVIRKLNAAINPAR